MSSKNSKNNIDAARVPPVLRQRLDKLRYQGHEGTLIQMHRSLIRLPLTVRDVITIIALAVIILAVWYLVINYVIDIWHSILQWWLSALQLDASVAMRSYKLTDFLEIEVPYLMIDAGVPGCTIWVITTIITALIFKLPLTNIPLRYLLKAMAFIQMCALAYFLVYPDGFPHQLNGYHFGMMAAGVVLITLVPVLYAVTYYIYDFKLWQKLSITLVAMFYLCLFVPFQYLLHVYLIHEASLLFLPILFFIFGLPLDILAVIAFYAWAMSWRANIAEVEEDVSRKLSPDGQQI